MPSSPLLHPNWGINLRLLIISGDPSGDYHAANVVKALRALNPDVQVVAVGGEHLKALGVELISDQSQMARVGLGSVWGAPYHYFLGKKILKFADDFKPDAVLHIDYGVFNLYMAKQLKARGFKTFYYIPPQVWASRPGRIQKIKKAIDHVFCIFPFEEQLYQRNDIPVTFVGHPLVGQLPPKADKTEFCTRYGLDPSRPIIALFPGSRSMEINYLLTPMIESTQLIRQQLPQAQFILAKASHLKADFFKDVPNDIQVIAGENHATLSLSDAIIAASGTVTLEAALYGTPMVIVYRGSALAYQIAIRLCRLPYIGLPNVLCSIPDINNPKQNIQPPTFPEFWQDDVNAKTITESLMPLLNRAHENPAFAALEKVKQDLTSKHPQGPYYAIAEKLLALT